MHTVSLTPGALRQPRRLLNAYVLLALAALSVWLLDGFNIGPINDGWIDFGLKLHQGGLLRHGNTSRILGSLPRALGTRLIDDSFVGWQLMLFVLTWLRGALFYDMVRRLLPRERLFALACGLIALVHPADNGWFWVDATGAHLGFVLALAACWSSLAWLMGGVRAWLFATFLFQFLATVTYTAYIPLMFAFPVGVWVLLWLQGVKPSWRRLLGVTALVLLAGAAQFALMLHGVGREGRVADLHLQAVLLGYARESALFFSATVGALAGFKPVYLFYAALPALLAWFVAREREDPATPALPPRTVFHWAMLGGLVALAAVSYFSYALSEVRFGNKRQLLAAGIFLYAALAYLLFVLLPPRLARWPRFGAALPPALLAVCALLTVVVGLEKRSHFVELYRAEEKLVAAVAALVPDPRPGSVVLVRLHSRPQTRQISGFTNRPVTFESALRAMYSEPSLRADFLRHGAQHIDLAADGITLTRRRAAGQQRAGRRAPLEAVIPFGQLILVDYPAHGRARLLGQDWLAEQAGGKIDVSAYQPGGSGHRPSPDAVTCTMLEKKFRPKYCAKK